MCNIVCKHYFTTMIIPTANLKVTVGPSHSLWLNHNACGYALSPYHVPLMQVSVTSGGRYEASGRHRHCLLATHHALAVSVLPCRRRFWCCFVIVIVIIIIIIIVVVVVVIIIQQYGIGLCCLNGYWSLSINILVNSRFLSRMECLYR